jgi:CheY-like chemotaxis protein/anti-sigma regulatory factor (Ser/Thr protein kinase)
VDLRAVLREALESTEAQVQEREHDLELELPEGPVVANGDLTRLVQIVTNLINNAAKYTDPHGSIRLSLVHEDETARITVQDNGRGITREDLPVIFDVFSQGRQSTAREDGGLGLGLALVRKLVELHGGKVEVTSDGAGQGSRFTVSLPATRGLPDLIERDGQQDVAEHDPTTKANPQRIVLVDDNRDVLESLTFFFQILGHEVWDLTAGEPVGALVEQVRPDVVILDIGLPDIDGIEVARRLAALPNRRAMKVIALSGYDEQTADPALFDAHVMKGTSTEALAALLDSR